VRLQRAGVDPTLKLKSQYPRAVQDEVIRVLAEEFYPKLTVDKAAFEIGADAIRHIEEGVQSRTLIRVLRLLPAMAAIKRLPTVFKTSNNYLEVKVNLTGDKAYDIDMNEAGAWPQYWLGLMHTANTTLFGYTRALTSLKSYDGHRAVIAIDLQPPK
jgi:uncharacterized protein (TIGR02265 family)